MRRNLVTALTLLGAPFALSDAWAASPVPVGTTATVNIRVAVKDKAKSDFASSTIARVMDAQCLMQAGEPAQVGMNGPTPEQEAAAKAAAAKGDALTQQLAPSMLSEESAAALEAEAAKCGDDQACIMEFAMKLQQNQEVMASAKAAAGAQGAIAGAMPDLGPVRYQLWLPQSCSGNLTADDIFVDSDPGGEGGDGAYTDTITIKGSGPIHSDWRGLMMETDLIAGTTSYRLMAPPPVNIASQSSLKGASERQVPLLAGTPLPETIGPLKGVGGKLATKLKSASGTVSIELKM